MNEVNTIASVIINLVLQILLIATVFFFLYKVGWHPFLQYLKKRQGYIENNIIGAEKKKDEAQELFSEAQEQLKKINSQTNTILSKAEQTAQEFIKNKKEQAAAEIALKKQNAAKELEVEKLRLQSSVQKESLDLALKVAAQFMQDKVDEKHTDMQIETFIKKMGD